MKLSILGTRGSIPSPSGVLLDGKKFSTEEFGGNTTCLYIETESNEKLIVDAGTGIKRLGDHLQEKSNFLKESLDLDIYFTHTHWDHIQGFPFFSPAYNSKNYINVYGEKKILGDLASEVAGANTRKNCPITKNIRDALTEQQNSRNFPVHLRIMKGLRNFYDFIPGGILRETDSLKIETISVYHPGGCTAFKFTEKLPKKKKNKILVINTDFEPTGGKEDETLIEFWRDTDLVYVDSQYESNSSTNPFKKGWGHSDPFINVDLALSANIRCFIAGHHDPSSDDVYLRDLEKRVKIYAQVKTPLGQKPLQVDFAREGKTYII